MTPNPAPDAEIAAALAADQEQGAYRELAAVLRPNPADAILWGTVEALRASLAADASDEATYDLLSVTFDEDEGEMIEVGAELIRRPACPLQLSWLPGYTDTPNECMPLAASGSHNARSRPCLRSDL